MMDKLAERFTAWLGSTTCLIAHTVALAAWFLTGSSTELLTMWLSVEAIYLTLFVLRAENVQSTRMEQQLAEDVERTREVHKVTVADNPDTQLGN